MFYDVQEGAPLLRSAHCTRWTSPCKSCIRTNRKIVLTTGESKISPTLWPTVPLPALDIFRVFRISRYAHDVVALPFDCDLLEDRTGGL